MKPLRLVLIVLAAAGLTGCFTSDKPLISDANAVAPYETITFWKADKPDDKSVLTREGKAYTSTQATGSLAMRFQPVGDDLYVAEMTGEQDGEVSRLYALVRFDEAAGTAKTYKSAAGDGDAGDGLVACKRDDFNMVCIEDLDAYIALAKAAATGDPDQTYMVSFE